MSLSLNNSTIVPLLSDETFTGSLYDNILDFAEINIAINCDTGYDLTYIYSQDKLSIDYQTTQSITAQVDTQFYKIPVNDRYFKLKIKATDGDMSVLNVQTIYKSNITFNNSGSGPTSNVSITSPLTGSGAVSIGGSVDVGNFPKDVGGNLKVSVQNTPLDVSGTVDISGQTVDISGQTVNISGQVVDISGQSVVVSGTVDISGQTIDISGQTIVVSNLNGVAVDLATNSLFTNVTNLPASYPVTNSDITNIYDVVNSRGSSTLWFGSPTGTNGVSLAVNFSSKNIKNISFMGYISGDTVLTVQFSNDNTTFYDSQYSYTLSSAGDVGFNLACCPNYLRLKSSNDRTATIIVNYC
jgi:hypothetical protein